jgi:hypothetical protein
VKAEAADVLKFEAVRFTKDVVVDREAGWKKPYVTRITYTTKSPLPSYASIAVVKEAKSAFIKKDQYFTEKFEKFISEYGGRVAAIAAMLPPDDLEDKWPMCVAKVSTKPLLGMMGEVLVVKDDGSAPFWEYVRRLNREWPGSFDGPEKVAALARRVWVELRESIAVMKSANRLVRMADEDLALLGRYEDELCSSW